MHRVSAVSNRCSPTVGGHRFSPVHKSFPSHTDAAPASDRDLDPSEAEMENSRSTMQKKPIRPIAAVCNNMGMGKDGKVPWDLPAEFKFFVDMITGVTRPGRINILVWGRLCWRSFPEALYPLPNVLHVVLSNTLKTAPDHAHFLCQDFESAIRLAAEPPLADIVETIWVIGGTRPYEDTLKHPWCDLLYVTEIMADFDCDVFFPEFDREMFKVQERFPGVPSGIQEENGVKYKFQVFKRISDA